MKELNIEAPEGYEIDNKKSDLSKGIVRFKKKSLGNYIDVCKKLFSLDKHFAYIDAIVIDSDVLHDFSECDDWIGNEAKSKKQIEALLALNKLKNVANYLNDGWKYKADGTDIGYFPIIDDTSYGPDVNHVINVWNSRRIHYGTPIFKTPELAKQAIEVLGEDTIRLALSFGSI